MFDSLLDDFDVYALDTPGFGRSTAPVSVIGRTGQEMVEFYADVFEELVTHLQLPPVCLIGHSFGGFLAANLAVMKPHCVQRVLLLSPAAMLPVSGSMGGLYSFIIFRFGTTHILSSYGAIGRWYINAFAYLVKCSPDVRYSLQLLSSGDNWGYVPVKMLGNFSSSLCYFTSKPPAPVLGHIGELTAHSQLD